MKLHRSGWTLVLAALFLCFPGFIAVDWHEARFDRASVAAFLKAPVPAAGTTLVPVPVVGASQASGGSASAFSKSSSAAWGGFPEPRLARFAEWAERYRRSSQPEKIALEAEGIDLARKRLDELIDLIQSRPDQALQRAVPFHVRKDLPSSIQASLEEQVSGRGTLAVLAALAAPGHEGEIPPVWRTASVGDRTYQAYVYGRRLGEPTRENISLHGIAVGDLLAVHENPVRILDLAEATARKQQLAIADPLCKVSGEPITNIGSETVADVGGETILLCNPGHAAALSDELVQAESSNSTASTLSDGTLAASAWTEGIKSIIVIRVDFDDLPGEPFSDAAGEAMISGVNAFYREMSYGKAGFELVGSGSAITPTLRMPQSAEYYGARDASTLRRDARAAAQALGFRIGDYPFDLICFGPVSGFKFAGLGYVGVAGAWFRDTSSVGVAAHELGHNLGLNHANFWDTAGQSVIADGTNVEYGDKFDTMGSANAGDKHFNARYKRLLNWITASEVTTVNQSGIYRIKAHDDPSATGVRALQIAQNSTTNYWIEYRAYYNGNKWLANGVGLRWARAGSANQSSLLLDVTPGTAAGKDDSPLLVGRTFSDFTAGVHITPTGKGADDTPWIEIVVNKGAFAGNSRPMVAINASETNTSPSTPISFAAQAADANNDSLAYFWDFGDGEFEANSPSATHAWSNTGEYLVQCTVSDMKGGVASASVIVRVGSPTTFRVSGRALANGQPVQGVRVSASSTRMTYTDSDGRFSLVGLAPGSYTIKAVLEGHEFISTGFQNPVRVGPSRDQVDFSAGTSGARNTMSLVAAGSVWQYLDDGSNGGTAWRNADFDDSPWSEGPAPLGYGDDDARTVVHYGPASNNKYVTTYFRHSFTVSDPRLITALTVGLRRDDGAVIYLNGQELLRGNMPEGAINYLTLAPDSVSGVDETTFFQSEVDPALLRAGVNVLAVEVHQSVRNSSDLMFDLELIATISAAPLPPSLAWDLANGSLRLSWPDSTGPWLLQSKLDFSSNTVWRPSNLPVALIDGQRVILIPPSQPQEFFRLASP